MKPGRELDILVAEKVMGWLDHVNVPNYSTDIAAAWEVVEKIKRRGNKKLRIEYRFKSDGWRVGCIEYGDNIEEGYYIHPPIMSETAPLAICMAALQLVGYEEV